MTNMLKRFPTWLVLVFGILLGSTLTSTLTFHLWWCEQRTLNLVRGREAIPLTPQVVRPTEHCVCGEALDALKRNSDAIPRETEAQSRHLEAHEEVKGDVDTELRLQADNVLGSKVSSMERYLSVNNSAAREGLVVAVLSPQGQLDWVESVYETWGRDAKQVLIFVNEKFNISRPSARGLPLVQLKGSDGGRAANMLLSVVHYLAEGHMTNSKWFMLAMEDSYVRIDRLQELLTQLNPMDQFYLGRWATGRKGEAERLGLKSHERYCLGSSGIVLSSALLSELRVHIERCVSDTAGLPDDVGLGKCISRVLDIQCSQSNESRNYFFEDYSGEQLTAEYIAKREIFSSFISYHPLPSLSAMTTLHQYYKHQQFTSLLEQLKIVQSQLSDVCGSATPASPISTISSDCAPPLCPGEGDGRADNSGAISSLSSPYLPTTIYDFQPWVYFDATTIFPDQSVYPSYKMKVKKNVRQELKQVLTKAVQRSSEHNGRPLKFKKLVNGWVRHDPFVGNEYIFDLLLVDGGRKVLSKRVNLIRPLGTNYITRRDSTNPASYVNMVVPLTKVNQRFKEFMAMYEELALETSEKVKLILSVYGQSDVQFVTNVVNTYRSKYPSAEIVITEGKGEFSRGRALHNGVAHLAPNELIFICDVDMKIRTSFFDRCRKNTILGRRVYYPEFFKLYNMDYVYWNQRRPKLVTLKRSHGHWAYYSFGMLCMYKSDYTTVGGMDTNIQGWGDEDVQFFNKVIRSHLDVLRAPDNALSHRWHPKLCSKSLSPDQFKHCLSSQQENLADRKELARYIQEKGVEIKGLGGVVDLASNATVDDDQDDYSYG